MTIIAFNRFIEFRKRMGGLLWYGGVISYGEFYGRFLNLPGFTVYYGRHIPITVTSHTVSAVKKILQDQRDKVP